MAHINANEIANQLKNFSNIVFVCGGTPSIDSLGATLGLALALSQTGKATQVLTKNPIRAEHSRIVGVDRVATELNLQQNYVIALPNAVDAIEKVSCYAEGSQLNIVLQPYGDGNSFDISQLRYTKMDTNVDAIVLIDVANMQEISPLFGNQSSLLQQVPVFAIGKVGDNRLQNQLVDPQQSATSQIIFALLLAMHLQINADVAGNLLQGIYAATNDFHAPTITPSVFEDSAKLLNMIHREVGRPQSPVAPPPPAPQPPRMQQPGQPTPGPNQFRAAPPPPRPPVPPPPRPPMPQPPMRQPVAAPLPPREVVREYEFEETTTGAADFARQNAIVTEMMQEALAQTRPPVPPRQNQPQPVLPEENLQQPREYGNQQRNQNRHNRNRNENQQRDRGQNNGPRETGQNQPRQNQNQSQPNQQGNEPEDWQGPKIYKTEDLL